MCILFHKWSRWSELKSESWVTYMFSFGVKISDYNFIRTLQERTCQRCGKVEKRYLETDP